MTNKQRVFKCFYVCSFLGSSFNELPDKLNNPKKGFINLRNNDKCFLWCHVRHLNLINTHATRISKKDRRIASTLDYSDVTFPVSEKDYGVIEDKTSICVNVFSYENTVYPVYVSGKKFDDCLNVLMIHESDSEQNECKQVRSRSHYVYIKDFNRLMFSITKNENKKWFCIRCLNVLVVNMF